MRRPDEKTILYWPEDSKINENFLFILYYRLGTYQYPLITVPTRDVGNTGTRNEENIQVHGCIKPMTAFIYIGICIWGKDPKDPDPDKVPCKFHGISPVKEESTHSLAIFRREQSSQETEKVLLRNGSGSDFSWFRIGI
jgi:hypothetical protein